MTDTTDVTIAKFTATADENPTTPTTAALGSKVPSYKYPLRLGVNHPGRIKFSSYKIDPVDFDFGVEDIKAFGDKVLSSRNSLSKQRTKDTNAAKNLSAEEQNRILEDSKPSEKTQSYRNLGNGTRVGSVELPLSNTINFNDAAVYQSTDLGIIGGGLESLASGDAVSLSSGKLGQAATGIAAQAAAAAAGTLAGAAIGATSGTGGAILGGLVGGGLDTGLKGASQSVTRVTSAPNERQLFKRVNLRKFSFSFKMVAMNKTESEEIKRIVKFFREEMYPEMIPITEGGLPLAYTYPNVFQIEIKSRTADNNPAFKIQRCYLETVATTFNATSSGMYDGDHFIEVDIALGFTEVTALNKQKIRGGF